MARIHQELLDSGDAPPAILRLEAGSQGIKGLAVVFSAVEDLHRWGVRGECPPVERENTEAAFVGQLAAAWPTDLRGLLLPIGDWITLKSLLEPRAKSPIRVWDRTQEHRVGRCGRPVS